MKTLFKKFIPLVAGILFTILVAQGYLNRVDYVYNRFLYNIGQKLIDLDTDNIKCAILSNAYTPSKDDDVWADVSTHEVSGTGYDAGGKLLANAAFVQDDANDKAWLDADNLTWTTVTFTNGRFAVLYADAMAADELICCLDFGADKSPSGDDFTIQFNALGILDFSQA
jgi:hypothetical protein